jgi:hypothetical protein
MLNHQGVHPWPRSQSSIRSGFSLILLLALLIGFIPAISTQNSIVRAQPELIALATRQPATPVDVIVQ